MEGAKDHAEAWESASPSLLYAQEHIFERVSVAADDELLTEALRHGRGRVSLEEVKGGLQLEESAGHMFRSGHEIATRESLERERQMVAAVNRGMGFFEPLGADREFIASDRLRPNKSRRLNSCCPRAIARSISVGPLVQGKQQRYKN